MTRPIEETMDLARRAVTHYVNRTTDQAPDTYALDVSAYTDPDRYRHEVERVFREQPLALVLSIEIATPNSYRATEVCGTPVIVTRDGEGKAHAFLNACRHRGAPVCADGRGEARQFSCPYHAWVYDTKGALVSMYGGKTFGDVDIEKMGLRELPCVEKAGLVWVCLTPGKSFDIDEWLGDFAAELETLDLGNWYLYDQRDLPGPGWKVAWDGYLEAYHHNTLHAETVGKYTVGNLMLHDTYGPHQRIVFGRKSLKEIARKPETAWADPSEHIRLIHSVFPNTSISGVVGDHALVSQVFPGPNPDSTLTRQSILCAKKPETDAEKAATEGFSQMTLRAVRDEDYNMGFQIQKTLSSKANEAFVFGRNEPALQHYHDWVARLSG
ncbi:Rieske (2Fe-2S) protein [Pararhodobacter marinus]|uniref:Rieske (2Fe-2S) protein n=1 Tax=Pararhodobacter marinus TaxID=2184063 RepID=A0A2U2C703_9RHOB|nr:aromatic ring-hydroxylating dioxygenase subunit alpha [Pararhodobacter marinus]PWE27647.1 Rieske (2Fe-2S) protein [Pararhodobacter marinus]